MIHLDLSAIKKIEHQATMHQNCISLSQGKLTLEGIPKAIKQHMCTLMHTELTDYYQSAWGIPALRQQIADYLNRTTNASLGMDSIIITHGSIGALSTFFLTTLEPGDHVLLPEPTYPAYRTLTLASRAIPLNISCLTATSHVPGKWDIEIEKIKQAATPKTKIIVFSNPCNPTGTIVSKKKLADLAEWCTNQHIYLIVDEVYDDYIFNGQFHSVTPWVEQSSYIIRTGSFSKNFSLSGWRVGYLVVPSELTQKLGRMQDALLNCPNVFAQYAALYALDHPEIINQFKNIVQSNLDKATRWLEPLIEKKLVSFNKPDAGFNIFMHVADTNTIELCKKLIEYAGVSMVPGAAFGPSGNNYLRLCYARKPDILHKGIQRFVSFLTALKS